MLGKKCPLSYSITGAAVKLTSDKNMYLFLQLNARIPVSINVHADFSPPSALFVELKDVLIIVIANKYYLLSYYIILTKRVSRLVGK